MNKKKQEQGYVLVTVAILAIALLSLAALAVDTGILFDSRTGGQRIVDAAALAGAFSFVVTPSAPQPATAQEYALSTVLGQTIRGVTLEADNVDVNVDVDDRIVTVTVNFTQDTFFARVLDISDAAIQVQAAAEASPTAVGSTCTKPWMLPNTVLIPEGNVACDACPGSPGYDPAVQAQTLIQGGAMTPFASASIGAPFTVKPQRPENALAPGQFYAIQVSEGTGGAVYRRNIATCSGSVFCANCYGVEPGNMVGPTQQGVRDLIGDPPDTYNATNQCFDPGCRDTSPSLIVVPVWDPCNTGGSGCQSSGFCPESKFTDSGANITVGVIGFALIFVQGVQGPNVRARLIGVTPCAAGGGAGGGEAGEGGGPFAVPIRLIQVPGQSS